MAMSNEEAETKEQSSPNFQRDMLLQVRAVEEEVHIEEPTKKLLYIPRVFRINLHTLEI